MTPDQWVDRMQCLIADTQPSKKLDAALQERYKVVIRDFDTGTWAEDIKFLLKKDREEDVVTVVMWFCMNGDEWFGDAEYRIRQLFGIPQENDDAPR